MALFIDKFKSIVNKKREVKILSAREILDTEYLRASIDPAIMRLLNDNLDEFFDAHDSLRRFSQNYSLNAADRYSMEGSEAKRKAFAAIRESLKTALNGVRLTLEEVIEFIHAQLANRCDSKLLGLFAGAAADIYGADAIPIKSQAVKIRLDGRGARLDNLFSFIRSIEVIEVENVRGDNICAGVSEARRVVISNCEGDGIARGVKNTGVIDIAGAAGDDICSLAKDVETITLTGCRGERMLSFICGSFKRVSAFDCHGDFMLQGAFINSCGDLTVAGSSCAHLMSKAHLSWCGLVTLKDLKGERLCESTDCEAVCVALSNCAGTMMFQSAKLACNLFIASEIQARLDIIDKSVKFELAVLLRSTGVFIHASNSWQRIAGSPDTETIVYAADIDYLPLRQQKGAAEFASTESSAATADNILNQSNWNTESLTRNINDLRAALAGAEKLSGKAIINKYIEQSKQTI